MIKFRAWEDREKEYIKDVLIGSDGKIYFDDGVATQDDLDISVEQFTGLTDVNGKDIYEGDIVENERGEILRVSYSAIDASFVAGNCYFGSIGAGKEIRIIGNVHANPELSEE